MFKSIYPLNDTTIYEFKPNRNTGADQILELTKRASSEILTDFLDPGEVWGNTTNSRILMKFDIDSITQAINNGNIGKDARFYLQLRSTETNELPIEYTLYVHALSGSFINGTGFYGNNPEITNGASWIYRSAKSQGINWATGSYIGSTGSWASIKGGGCWWTSSQATETFNYEKADTNIEVTSIVKQWVSGSFPNDGFIIKHDTTAELDDSILGSIKFFGKDTHTIYIPKLEIYWNDVNLSGTGSFNEIDSANSLIYMKNVKSEYDVNEVAIMRIGSRDLYPTHTYTTSSIYTTTKRLPVNSYFMITDAVTDEIIVKYNNPGTQVNCDSQGNYIKVDMSSLLPQRMYKIVFRCEFDNGAVKIINNNYKFTVKRLY